MSERQRNWTIPAGRLCSAADAIMHAREDKTGKSFEDFCARFTNEELLEADRFLHRLGLSKPPEPKK